MSIRLKLAIMFLAIALIPLLLFSTITFTNYKNSLEASRLLQLRELVTFRAERIEDYFAKLKTEIEMLQHSYLVRKNLPVLTRLANNPVDPEFLAAKKMLDDVLRKTPSIVGLSDIMLVNPEGKIVYSSNPEQYPINFLNILPGSQQKAFEKRENKIYFSDVFLNKAEGDKSGLLITAPVVGFNGVFIGVIALEVDMAPIYNLIQDITGLGETGEALVGKKTGNQVVLLSPLRHNLNHALKRIHVGDILGGPMQEAVQGKEGGGQLVDYRGKKVIAAWRYIPSLNWGIVAKMDTQEAFADVVNLGKLVIIILVIILVVAGITAFSIALSISEPIKRLTKGAEIIGSGDLDYKIGTNLKDEIGQLSRSFDKMTLDLKQTTASRDALNKEITERKKAEHDLKRSNESLEQFAYAASHDLQEPLRIMAGFSALLERRYKDKLGEEANQFIGYIVEAANRMQKLITDLLAYSRVARIDEPVREIDCNVVLEDVIHSLGPAIKGDRAEVTFDELPTVTGTESNFMRLFQNLIGNALKFRGPDLPRIHVSARKHRDHCVFSVSDNGIGIEPQYKDRIFIIFQRLHEREKYPGTGIGLSICKKIVETQGGRIWVESEHGRGSTFYFTIPAKGGVEK